MVMPKVRLLVPMVGEKSWNIGDEFECTAAEARRLFKAKMAERMPKPDAPEADGGKPADDAQDG
jgi:hypothetical protein